MRAIELDRELERVEAELQAVNNKQQQAYFASPKRMVGGGGRRRAAAPFERRPIVADRRRVVADHGVMGNLPQVALSLNRKALGGSSNYAHWLHTGDGGRQGYMGAVHMVRPPQRIHRESMANHFMTELEEDANRGQQMLFHKAKGPFRSRDPSRIQARSAHITYRRRGNVTEITITRGISNHELELLQSKLSMHRSYHQNTVVSIIVGRTDSNVGYLHQVDISKLVTRIMLKLGKSRVIGLKLTDSLSSAPMRDIHSHRMAMSHTRQHNYR